MRRLRAVLAAVFSVTVCPPLLAQDPFEIEVYPYATAHRGEWELEAHLNHATRGTRSFDGLVAPTQGQVRFAAELTRGITDHWELSGYLLGAQVPDLGLQYAGYRVRSRVRAPERWRLPVRVGFAVEYEGTRPAFSESARTLELTPILERRFGDLQLSLNPTLERDLAGPDRGEWEFEPKARAALDLSPKLTLGLEYYGSLGEFDAFLPAAQQVHQFYPTADVRLGDELSLHLGVGFGATTSGDRVVFKTRLELPLGEK